jgi:hypothetical protein
VRGRSGRRRPPAPGGRGVGRWGRLGGRATACRWGGAGPDKTQKWAASFGPSCFNSGPEWKTRSLQFCAQ